MDALTAAQNVAEDYPGGARALAVAIDKPANTFYQELSGTGSAKLGLVTAVKMTKRSKDPRILNAFAAECGYMVLQLPEALMVDGDATMGNLGQLAKEFADVVQEVSASCADDKVSANELERVERQWGELMAAGQRMLSHMRAKHEASKPANLRAVG